MSKRRSTSKDSEYQRQRQERSRKFWIGVIVATGLIALAALVLYVRPSSSTPADESPEVATARAQWPIVIADEFDVQANGWLYGPLTENIAEANLSAVAGKYHWELAPSSVVLWPSLVDQTLSTADLYAAVDARQISGTTRSDYGLVFRWNTNNDYYYYQISPSAQQFAFNLYYGGQWIPLIDWQAAPTPIETENPNRLAVAAEGSRFTLYLNGQVAGSTTDNHLTEGSVGVGVQIYFDDPSGNFGTYEFDNFEWRAP